MHVPTSSSLCNSSPAFLSVAGPPGSAIREQPGRPASRFNDFLLDVADPGLQSRVLLIGLGTLEIGCELIRLGALDVSIARARSRECPHDAKADIAVMPLALSAALIDSGVATARRLLCPLGSLVLGQVPVELAEVARAKLRSHGFGRLQSWPEPDGLVIRAELPMVGGMSCA